MNRIQNILFNRSCFILLLDKNHLEKSDLVEKNGHHRDRQSESCCDDLSDVTMTAMTSFSDEAGPRRRPRRRGRGRTTAGGSWPRCSRRCCSGTPGNSLPVKSDPVALYEEVTLIDLENLSRF